jgi:hypothetical protein
VSEVRAAREKDLYPFVFLDFSTFIVAQCIMNFEEPNANLVSHEFLAVILAGFGDECVWTTNFCIFCVTIPFRLHPLTNDHGDEPCPKALLPVANMPMIDFPLTWLEQSGITGVFFVLAFLFWHKSNAFRGVAHLSHCSSLQYLSPYSFRHIFFIVPVSPRGCPDIR